MIIALVVVVAFAAFIIATACVWFKHHNIDHEKYADAETNIENTNINN